MGIRSKQLEISLPPLHEKSKPLISIILPVHNSEKFLRESLQSLVSQSYRNIEIIAIGDQSTDNSYKILKTFNKNYKKVRIYRNVKRYSIVTTLNRLMKRAKGQFLAFASADDICSKEKVKKQISYLKLWLKSIVNYDYNPSIRSLSYPLLSKAT